MGGNSVVNAAVAAGIALLARGTAILAAMCWVLSVWAGCSATEFQQATRSAVVARSPGLGQLGRFCASASRGRVAGDVGAGEDKGRGGGGGGKGAGNTAGRVRGESRCCGCWCRHWFMMARDGAAARFWSGGRRAGSSRCGRQLRVVVRWVAGGEIAQAGARGGLCRTVWRNT